MAVVAISGQQATLTSTLKSFITLACPATNMRRFKVFDINVSQGGAPASTDTNIEFQMSRYTGAVGIGTAGGTSLAVVEPGDTYIQTTALVNLSAEPGTPTATILFDMYLNQRAPYRWQTYLGSGAELVMPATASIGCRFAAQSAGYTAGAGGTVFFQEQ
jgi:hypothetical protein